MYSKIWFDLAIFPRIIVFFILSVAKQGFLKGIFFSIPSYKAEN